MPTLMIDGEPVAHMDEGSAQVLLRAASVLKGEVVDTANVRLFDPVVLDTTERDLAKTTHLFQTMVVRLEIGFTGHLVRIEEVKL